MYSGIQVFAITHACNYVLIHEYYEYLNTIPMQLYEWEAKDLLEAHGVNVPRRVLIRDMSEVESAYAELGCSQIVVKAQVMSV